MAIGQGETPILPEIKIPLPLGNELPTPVLQGGISLTQNWDKNGNIFYTDENGNRVNNSIGLLENLKRKAQTIGTNIKDAFNSQPYDRRDTFYTSPMPTLINQYDNGAISADELARLSKNRMDDEIYRAEKDQRESNLRSGLGTAISGASFLPIFNIPYVGTGIGGAMYDIGQGLVEGDNINDIANRAGRGFAIGESVGAIPYVGRALGQTKTGQAVTRPIGEAFNKLAETPFMQKTNDILMTDIIPNSNKSPIYYHGTAADFDKFSPDFIGTAHDEGIYGKGFYFTPHKSLAQSYADSARNGINPRVIAANLEMKNPLIMEKFNSAEELAKYLDMEENIGDFVRSDYNGKTIFRPNGFLQKTGKFKGRVQDLGHDGVIVGDNEVVVFSPEQINQIKQINQPSLYEQLINKSNMGAASDSLYDKIMPESKLLRETRLKSLGINPKEKTNSEIMYNSSDEFDYNKVMERVNKMRSPKPIEEGLKKEGKIVIMKGSEPFEKGEIDKIITDTTFPMSDDEIAKGYAVRYQGNHSYILYYDKNGKHTMGKFKITEEKYD